MGGERKTRKLAWFGLFLLIALVVVISAAVWNVGFRESAWNAVQGTVLVPAVNWITATWVHIGDLGFTFIAATSLGMMIFGALFGYFVAYEAFWKRGVQKHIMGRTQTSSGTTQPAPAPTPLPLAQNEQSRLEKPQEA